MVPAATTVAVAAAAAPAAITTTAVTATIKSTREGIRGGASAQNAKLSKKELCTAKPLLNYVRATNGWG